MAHGRDDAAPGGGRVRRHQEDVVARPQRADRLPGPTVAPGSGAGHLQRVGDHQPVEAEVATQDAGDHAARHRRRRARIERADVQMTGHHRRDSRVHGGPEGREVDRVELVARTPLHGQRGVTVRRNRAVPGEVLEHRHDAGLRHAGGRRDHVPGDQVGVRADRARADRRVTGTARDVGIRSEVDREAQAPQLGTAGGRSPPGCGHVVGCPGTHERGKTRRLSLDALDDSALLVDRQEQRPASRDVALERAVDRADLGGRGDVVIERDHTAQVQRPDQPDRGSSP